MTARAKTGTDAPEALRDLAEKGAAQAKENLETMSAAAEEATDVLKHSYATTVTSIQDYTAKVFEFTSAQNKSRKTSTFGSPVASASVTAFRSSAVGHRDTVERNSSSVSLSESGIALSHAASLPSAE